MSDTLLIAHTAIAVTGIILMITILKIEAIVALTAGSLYLGLASGLGLVETAEAVATGFGEIMTEIGLLITFGVLIGALLAVTGALERLTSEILTVVRAEHSPYVFGGAASSIFVPIYGDVMLVLMTPLGRSIARRMGRDGLPFMGSAIAIGPQVGNLMVVPGSTALAVAALLEVPLGEMLLFGAPFALSTVFITLFLYRVMLSWGFWNSERDELGDHDPVEEPPETEIKRRLPLAVLLTPLAVAVILIGIGGISRGFGVESTVIEFISTGTIALFAGLLLAYLVAWRAVGTQVVGAAFSKGLRDVGPILVVTGIGGSFGYLISLSGLGDVLGDLFSASSAYPILFAWGIAAILHLAIGSSTVATITAATIIFPLTSSLDIPLFVLALAAASGALLAVHVNSNYFWMVQRLMGFSTRGALKTCTVITSMASVVALILLLTLGLVV